MNNKTATSQEDPHQHLKEPARALLKIVHGDVENLKIPHKSILVGKKIKNDVLRRFAEMFQQNNPGQDKELVNTILTFDEAVEKELLTDEILDEIRRNPEVLKKYFEEE